MRREGGQEGQPCILPVNRAQVPVCPVQGAKGTQTPGNPGAATGLKDLMLCSTSEAGGARGAQVGRTSAGVGQPRRPAAWLPLGTHAS